MPDKIPRALLPLRRFLYTCSLAMHVVLQPRFRVRAGSVIASVLELTTDTLTARPVGDSCLYM